MNMEEMIKNYSVGQITWEEIYSVWYNKLWTNRQSLIEPISSMKYLGGYDKNIKNNTPYFVGARFNGKLVGVNSVFKTADLEVRSRGIWVDPEHRMSGIGFAVMDACIELIKNKENAKSIWSAPRESALAFYQKCGYTKTSEFTHDGFEFGPNCYVLKKI